MHKRLAFALTFFLLAAGQRSRAQTFGMFVPVSTVDSALPENLDAKYVSFDHRFRTRLPFTPANLERVNEQVFTLGAWMAHAKAASLTNYNPPGYAKSPDLPDEPGVANREIYFDCDWDESEQVDPEVFLRSAAEGEFLQTEDGGLRLLKVGAQQFKVLVKWNSRGHAIASHPRIREIWRERSFQQENPGKEDLERQARDQIILPPEPRDVLSLGLGDALQLTQTMGELPLRMAAELRKPALRIVISMRETFAGHADPGVALLIRSLRLTSQPLDGKEGMEIPIDRYGIFHCRTRPPLREFAEMLGSDIDDPEVVDRHRRCPPVTLKFSEFELPDGCVIPAGSFRGAEPMYRWKNGTPAFYLAQIWESSLGADAEGKFTGFQPRDPGGAGQLIGHYYIVSDGREIDRDNAVEEKFSKTFSISRTEGSRFLRSRETTMSVDVEVGADFGLTASESFSLSETNKSESERSKGSTTELSLTVERTVRQMKGALVVYKMPVLLTVDQVLQTSRFTFDRQMALSLSASRTIAYRNEAGTGLLRRVRSETDPSDTSKTIFSLGDVIAGDDLIVIRTLGLPHGMENNHFVGRWRETALATGQVRLVDIAMDGSGGSRSDGILTYRTGPEPHQASYRLVVQGEPRRSGAGSYDGAGVMKNLLDDQEAPVLYQVRPGPMGPGSKIVIRNQQGDPITYMVRVGGS